LAFGIPLLIIGQRITTEGYLDEHIPNAQGNALLVYWLLKPPENYRYHRIIPTHYLDNIIWKSKLNVLTGYPKLLETYVNETRNPYSSIFCIKTVRYEKLIGSFLNCTTVEEFCETLAALLASPEKSKKQNLPPDKPINPIELLHTYDIGRFAQSNIRTITLALSLIFKLALINQVKYLDNVQVTLCLTKLTKTRFCQEYIGEGDLTYLKIRDTGSDRVFYVPGKLPKKRQIVTERKITLYAPHESRAITYKGNRIYKHFQEKSVYPDIAGVWWGNPLACVALITIGAAPENLKASFQESVAAIIELEDRPSRTANLPDPWPYNLMKVMRATVSNPNIRYLIIISAGVYCRETIERIENRQDLPPHLHPFISSDLVLDFKDQILDCVLFEIEKPLRLQKDLNRKIRETYLEPRSRGWRDESLFQRGLDSPNISKHRKSKTEGISRLVNQLISQYNSSQKGQITNTEIVANTIGGAYPGILATILKYGEQKGPDSLQRIYKDILTHRTVIKDISRDLLCLGIDREGVDNYFQNEWMQPDGLFFKRMHESFDADQVVGAIERICRAVKSSTVTRSVIINIHHPGLDKRRPLGINEAYFALRPIGEKSYEIVGTFVWRSVEALFGMPYSLYASARFQRYVVDQCAKQLGNLYELKIGEMIYMSLNLHLYQDTLNMEVSEQIIKKALQNLTE
jgi:hypothetical protein